MMIRVHENGPRISEIPLSEVESSIISLIFLNYVISKFNHYFEEDLI
jgi:hypothetical protein